MSHPEQFGFFSAVHATNEELIQGGRILEIGSYDVNGSVRGLFAAAAEYVGVDLEMGPSVDLVSYGHEVRYPDAYFDASLSGECFEHDPHWRDTFLNMCRMTRPGGLVAFTCASDGRPEHGTTRTDATDSPGTQAEGLDYYRNLSAPDFERSVPLNELFSEFRFWTLPTSFDLYFAGVRVSRGEAGSATPGQIPPDAAVFLLRSLMPTAHRLARMPLRVMHRILPARSYQSFAVPYWRTLSRLQERVAAGMFDRENA